MNLWGDKRDKGLALNTDNEIMCCLEMAATQFRECGGIRAWSKGDY
jgi:hypothetical protein